MVLSSRTFAENLHLSSKTIGLQQILKLQQAMQKQNPKVQNKDLIRWLMYSPLVDLHDSNIQFGTADIVRNRNMDHFGNNGYRKYIPDNVRLYDLTHDDSNASGISFHTPGESHGTKYHGAAVADGNSYQIIHNHDWLNPTDGITIAAWLYLPSLTSGSHFAILNKPNQYSLLVESTNKLRLRIKTASGLSGLIELEYAPDTWFHCIATYDKANGMKLYQNKILKSSYSLSGDIKTTADDLGILGYPDGTNKAINGTGISWLSILHGEALPNWISQHYNGILNTNVSDNGLEEITTIPYLDSPEPMPDSFEGMFVSS